MDSDCAKIPKPNLKGLHTQQIFKNLAGALVSSVITGFLLFLHNRRKKEKYREFYYYYDAEAAFERMRKKGVFDSASAPK